MTDRTQWGFLASVFAMGLAGCEGACPVSPTLSSPSAPLPSSVSAVPTLIMFTERGTGFSTSEVRDVEEQVLQLNTANELIWTPDGTRYHVDRRYPGVYFIVGRFAPKAVPSKFVSEPGTARGAPA